MQEVVINRVKPTSWFNFNIFNSINNYGSDLNYFKGPSSGQYGPFLPTDKQINNTGAVLSMIPFTAPLGITMQLSTVESAGEAGMVVATSLPFMKIANGTASILKGAVSVEQYALRAAADGFYPVMKRGFKESQELVWLNRGDVWKFGTTKNPLTRYSQSYLKNTGAGLEYVREFSGSLTQSRWLESSKILNFKSQTGFLPAGNKI